MSVVMCMKCDRYIDTDYISDGGWLDNDYVCQICVDRYGIEMDRHDCVIDTGDME